MCPESEPASPHSPSDREGTLSEPMELTALSLEVSMRSTSVRDMLVVPFIGRAAVPLLESSILMVYMPKRGRRLVGGDEQQGLAVPLAATETGVWSPQTSRDALGCNAI